MGDGASGVSLSIATEKGVCGDAAKSDYVLKFSNVAGETSATVIFNFVDGMGVQTPITVSYKK